MPVGLFGQSLQTLGIELEGTGLDRGTLQSGLATQVNNKFARMGNVLTVGKDASVEFFAEYIRTPTVHFLTSIHTDAVKKLSGFGNSDLRRVLGYELITSPLEIPQIEPVIYDVVYRLLSLGDFGSKRASTHYHVGFPHNLRMMKNLLRVCLSIDPILFRLGGMGGEFRGNFNLACYARPLLNSACVPLAGGKGDGLSPAEVKKRLKLIAAGLIPANSLSEDSYRWVQIINPHTALAANSVQEFWAAFGIDSNNPAGFKYHPSRYTGINFFAIPSHGTIEFRHGNWTRNPGLVIAYGKFLRMAVEMSALLTKTEVTRFDIIDSNKEISIADASSIMSMILEISREKELEDLPTENEMALLIETLGNSSFTELPEIPVKTHIKDFSLDSRLFLMGRQHIIKEPLSSKSLDIHNITETSYSIFD